VGPKRTALREATSFTFTLTDKDSGLYSAHLRRRNTTEDLRCHNICNVIFCKMYRKNALWDLRELLPTYGKSGGCGWRGDFAQEGKVQHHVSQGELEEEYGKKHGFCFF